MSWAKVDDRFCVHPKVLGTSLAARGLWVSALSWTAGALLDGVVPHAVVAMFGAPSSLVEELLAAGLWLPHPDGYQFRDYLEHNPSREKVLAEREATRVRVQKLRSNAVGNGSGNAVSNTSPVPVPVPVPDPVPKKKISDRARLRSRRVPNDFSLTPERKAFATSQGLTGQGTESEFAKFKDHEFQAPRSDWDAALRNWFREAVRRARGTGAPVVAPRPSAGSPEYRIRHGL